MGIVTVGQVRGACTSDEEMDWLCAKHSAQLASELEGDDRAHAVTKKCERDVEQRDERKGESLDQWPELGVGELLEAALAAGKLHGEQGDGARQTMLPLPER